MSSSLNSRCLVVLSAAFVGLVIWAPGNAHARVPGGPRLDSVSIACGQIQDQYDQAVRDMKNAGTQAQYDAAKTKVESLVREWNGSPCSRTFGSLLHRQIPVAGVKGPTPTLADPKGNSSTSTGGLPNGGTTGASKPKSIVQRSRSAKR